MTWWDRNFWRVMGALLVLALVVFAASQGWLDDQALRGRT